MPPSLPASCTLAIGDRIHLIPSHTDHTVNLDVFTPSAARVVDVWLIAARKRRTPLEEPYEGIHDRVVEQPARWPVLDRWTGAEHRRMW
jgi:hypothetical protein